MIRRRHFLAGAAASLAAPSLVRAEPARVLRFIPQADLAAVDPVWTSVYVTRNHGYAVFDTLYGQDSSFAVRPQMVEGAQVERDGLEWRLRLRDGLRFHDGTPVLARDCVASIRRWGRRDAWGQTLLAATDELSAADDRTIVFRLRTPCPWLPDALGKIGINMLPIMPERLASTDPFKQVTEVVGSGPFRFLADERVSGARFVYARFEDYRPREDGAPDWTAGPKIAHFDRVECSVIPDGATAAAALQRGEADWWEQPLFDLLPTLQNHPGLADRLGRGHRQYRTDAVQRAPSAVRQPGHPARALARARPVRVHERRRRRSHFALAGQDRLLRPGHADGERAGARDAGRAALTGESTPAARRGRL